MSAFWIIDTETPGEHERSKTAIGPFPSLAAAERRLKDDAEHLFMDADKSCRELNEIETWGAPMIIVEERRTVRQVPTVKVSVRLEDVL